MDKKKASWARVWEKLQDIFQGIEGVFSFVWKWIMHLRKILLAIPVVILALRLAQYTTEKLPEQVGLNLQETGEYALTVTKEVAVLGPLAVTAACLLLMFCSRRTVYPWIISLFSLVLPLLILITNIFPS